MLDHPPLIEQSTPIRSSRSWRWVAVLIASVLLHLIALEWANGVIALPNWHEDPISTVTMVQLLAPTLPTPSPATPKSERTVKRKIKPPVHPVAKAAPPAPTNGAMNDAIAASIPGTDTAIGKESALVTAEANAEPAVNQPPPQDVPVADAKTDAPGSESQPHYKIDLPPPVELKYEVKKVPMGGSPMYGNGSISWQSTGTSYQVLGEAHVLFISLFNFKSEGVVGDFGVTPVLYSQKSFHRSETDTHFNRDERNSISFSASSVSYPIKGGEQDRGSIMWELAAIGRGDPEKFVPGAQIDLFVAGVRDGDIWSILVADQEEIETGDGKTLAWHVVRTPRAGTYDQKIDIWLAPQFQWSPVKIRYTDKNGDYLDMSMTAFHSLQVASTPTDPAR
jgi:hypothetical protein